MIMFRLFLIISLLFTIGSCSNTRQDKNNLKISSLSNHLQKKGKSIILVMDFGDSDYQIIEYCDTILTYGIGYIKNANTISNNNIQVSQVGENGAFPPTRNGCIHSLSMRERG